MEAKVQNYDGDDWGDDSYDDEPEEPPPPAKPSVRQPGQSGQLSTTHSSAFMPPPRTFSQPVPANAPQTVLSHRAPSFPAPSSVSQNRSSPPIAATGQATTGQAATGQAASRFPPRKSSMRSMKQQEGSDTAESSSGSRPQLEQKTDVSLHGAGGSEAPGKPSFVRPSDIYRRLEGEKESQRLSLESGRPSMDSVRSRGDSVSPANAPRSSTEQRQRTNLDRDDGTPRSPRSTLAPVAERKSEYGLDRLLANTQAEPNKGGNDTLQPLTLGPDGELNENPRRFSTSPKLPDLSRVSGFGEDFFANSLRFSTGPGSLLPSVTEGQSAPAPSQQNDGLKQSIEPVTQPRSSVLEGPKLDPNPSIIMPSSSDNARSGTSGPVDTTDQQPTPPRPQLPGGWVSETSALGPEDIMSAQASPGGTGSSTPVDLEPTTQVKSIPSTGDNAGVPPEDRVTQVHQGDFGSVAGHHDDAVASKVISAGPGHHPTPHSLPPLQTQSPLGPASASRNQGKSPPIANATESSLDNRSRATTASEYTPTAPLNPYRLSISRPDFAVENTERKSTTSTVGTGSPYKESDKLREEIMKTLSPSQLNSSSFDEVLANPNQEQDEATRESRYLSGVYDDYLSLAEEKTLLETGRALKNESMLASHQSTEPRSTADATPQMDTPIPPVAPLSPKRTSEPELEPGKRPRRFSWEQPPAWETMGPTKTGSTNETAKESGSPTRQHTGSSTEHSPEQPVGATSGLTQPEGTGTPHEPPKPNDRANGPARVATPDQPSPVSMSTDSSPAVDVRRSLAEEKVLIESSSHLFEPPQTEHPALSEHSDSLAVLSPTSLETPANPSTQPLKIMAFREILSLPSPNQRTQKFDDTRHQFFGMDSGLSNWLMHMSTQLEQPEGTRQGDSQQTSTVAQSPTAPPGMQQSSQQPYYQQYLNASAPNMAMGPPRRTSTGNLLAQSGPTTSGFNSGNQVGAKGKELLHTAGAFGNKGIKSGMKLFSKGKSKLRERANDKVFF